MGRNATVRITIRCERIMAPPWSEARLHKEVMAELKLTGDHLDRKAGERALRRRQARQVQRVEEEEAEGEGAGSC
jgi:hypothetical protein